MTGLSNNVLLAVRIIFSSVNCRLVGSMIYLGLNLCEFTSIKPSAWNNEMIGIFTISLSFSSTKLLTPFSSLSEAESWLV